MQEKSENRGEWQSIGALAALIVVKAVRG